jgi:hypothetical protein
MSTRKDLQLGWYGSYVYEDADCLDHIYYLHIGHLWVYWIKRIR